MKNFLIGILFLAVGTAGCKGDNEPMVYPGCIPCSKVENLPRDEAQFFLQEEYNAIQDFALNRPCANPSEWTIIPIGSKACGGPTGFIAYHKSIDEGNFLKQVEYYTKAQNLFNKKWGIASTCDIAIKPTKVECVDGKVKLIK